MAKSMIAFDIGGTWFRSCVRTESGFLSHEAVPAISKVSCPHLSGAELIERLVTFIVERTERLRLQHPNLELDTVAISLGAALNPQTGEVFASAPLWGKEHASFFLDRVLRGRLADVNWVVQNDVSAMLYDIVRRGHGVRQKKVALLLVSTGIALRVYDSRTQQIPVDSEFGLQGEVGHVPAHFSVAGVPVTLTCECGSPGHLSAYSSGRGLQKVREHVSQNGFVITEDEFLMSVTRPIAVTLIQLFSVDPEIDLVFLAGGVVDGLGSSYKASLFSNLRSLGLYIASSRDPDFFEKKIRFYEFGKTAGLEGACWFAEKYSRPKDSTDSRTRTVRACREDEYRVHWVDSPFSPDSDELIQEAGYHTTVFVDSSVPTTIDDEIRTYFGVKEGKISIHRVAAGEGSKSLSGLSKVCGVLAQAKLRRRQSSVIAVGGGALLDLVGFAAATYRRGIRLIKIPTTLLGIVDAAVGVKNGINFEGHKNRLGTYTPPSGVFLSPRLIETLPVRQVRNGMAEMLKIAIVLSKELFGLLETFGNDAVNARFVGRVEYQKMIRLSVDLMLDQLEPNLWERNLNRLVDFGHTFGPLLEMNPSAMVLHGESVAIDMALSTAISYQCGRISREDAQRIILTIQKLGLPTWSPCCTIDLLTLAIEDAILHRDGQLRLPIPTGIGVACFLDSVTEALLVDSVTFLQQIADHKGALLA